MKIVHLEAGKHLYGGAYQVLLLVEGLTKVGVDNVLVLPKGSAVAEEARTRGLPIKTLPMAGDADLAFPFRFRRLLRDERPDLVHLHSRRGADTLGALTTKMLRLPTVLSRRVDNPEPGWSLGAKYRLFDAVITISEAIRQVLVSQGVPEGKVQCVRSALDPNPYLEPCHREAFLKSFDLPENSPTIGMAAQFIPRKGHGTLLDAAPSVLKAHPSARFLLFGKGPLKEEIEREVEIRGLAEAFRFPGFRDDLPELLPCLDLLIHPAAMEGLGVILLQASAAGIPVVASAVGGIPEAVAHLENGLLIPPGKPSALADGVNKVLADPALARRMGEEGKRRVADLFSVSQMIEGNLGVYRTVLGR